MFVKDASFRVQFYPYFKKRAMLILMKKIAEIMMGCECENLKI
jgi:hypothetical protein